MLELFFEIIVRPKGYFELIQSDRAFAPSTARYINWFHLIFESIALITYIPEFRCLAPYDICRRDTIFSRISSSLDAVVGVSNADSARGRFVLGLTALRLFGLFRHWRQMFINNTFRLAKREGLDKWLIPRATDHGDSISTTRKRSSTKKNEVRSVRCLSFL